MAQETSYQRLPADDAQHTAYESSPDQTSASVPDSPPQHQARIPSEPASGPSAHPHCSMNQQPSAYRPAASSDGESSSGIGVHIAFVVVNGLLIFLTSMVALGSAPNPGAGPPTFACFLVCFLRVLPMVYAGFNMINCNSESSDAQDILDGLDVASTTAPNSATRWIVGLRGRRAQGQENRHTLIYIILFLQVFSFFFYDVMMVGMLSWFTNCRAG